MNIPNVIDEEDLRSIPVNDLGLPTAVQNRLLRMGIHTAAELMAMSEQDIRDVLGFGKKAINAIREVQDRLQSADHRRARVQSAVEFMAKRAEYAELDVLRRVLAQHGTDEERARYGPLLSDQTKQ